MPKINLKLPEKLSRVEIIHGSNLKIEDYFNYLPLDKMPMQDYSLEDYDEEVAELRNSDTELDIFTAEDIPINEKFYHEVAFTEQLKPVTIDTEKLPEEVVPLEEVKKRVQTAYDKGFADGQEVSANFFSEEMKKHEEWIRNIDTVTKHLRHEYSKDLNRLEDLIVSLGIMTAKHILQAEVSSNSKIVIGQVKKAIAELDDETIFQIFVHPDSYDILNSVKSKLLSSPEESMKIKILRDEKVDPGGCILVTSSGIIDARLKTQLATIKLKFDSVPLNPDVE